MASNHDSNDAKTSFAMRLSSKFRTGVRAPTCIDPVASESLFTRLPNEVLHRVFFFAIYNCDESQVNHRQLLDICTVNRQWYLSAVDHCLLWTTLPPVYFDCRRDHPRSLRRGINGVTLFLMRSGTLPVSFTFIVTRSMAVGPNCNPHRDVIRIIVNILVSQCHRWRAAHLKLPSYSVEDLMQIRGRLPMLTQLKLSSPRISRPTDPDTQRRLSTLFEDAPQLKCVSIQTPGLGWGFSTPPTFILPWAGLENFEYTQEEDKGAYPALMEAQPTQLRSIVLRTRSLRNLPPTALRTLPQLEKLVFQVQSGIEADIFSHIGALTLPALTHLELWGRVRHSTEEAYEVVRGLVERSGCSLRSLYLCTSSIDGSVGAFSELLDMSPGLETFHLTVPRADILRQLVVDPAAPITPLPNLRKLGLHAWYSATMSFTPVDLEALRLVIESRAVASMGQQGGLNQTLNETIFVYTSDANLFRDLFKVKFLNQLGERNTDLARELAIQSVKYSLQWNSSRLTHPFLPRWHRRSPLAFARMDAALRAVERLKFKDCDTQVLVRYGLVELLHRISKRPDDFTLGDTLLRFSSRARNLLEKWKPCILRDARAAEYQWFYYGAGVASLKSKQGSECCTKSDEELWSATCGVEDGCSAYTGLKKWASFAESFV